MEIVSAPNGTRYLKPDFECVLYEEVGKQVYGRVFNTAVRWTTAGAAWVGNTFTPGYNLTLAPAPWYENITDPVLCRVEGQKLPYFVISFKPDSPWPLRTSCSSKFRIEECTPLTSEEVYEYIIA